MRRLTELTCRGRNKVSASDTHRANHATHPRKAEPKNPNKKLHGKASFSAEQGEAQAKRSLICTPPDNLKNLSDGGRTWRRELRLQLLGLLVSGEVYYYIVVYCACPFFLWCVEASVLS